MRQKLDPPQITQCARHSQCGKKCDNRVIFSYMETYNRSGEVVEWEIECPMCGTIWWIPVKAKAHAKPKKYSKS